MKDLQQYIESGILEAYLSGSLTDVENAEVEKMILAHPEIEEELLVIAAALEEYAQIHAVQPDPTLKPFLMATIDFMKRMENGETPSFPPMLTEDSRIEDYNEWLNRPDISLQDKLQGVYAKIIGYTPEQMTAVVWLEYMAPAEIHTDEFEKFLIVEGTCDITIGETVHHMKPGDYMQIPLYTNHFVTVTSPSACKVILQRIAA